MSEHISFRRILKFLLFLEILGTCFMKTGSIHKPNLIPNLVYFAESVVTGNITVCVNKDNELFDAKTCEKRLHTNVDVAHGLRDYHYIFRSKADPTKGLYVIMTTSKTSVVYKMEYKTTVPLSYKEHTETKDYKELGGDKETACSRVSNPKCTPKDKLPPGLTRAPTVCCVCGVNVDRSTLRGNYSCSMERGTAMSYSCLEFSEPWYNLYKMSYPPDLRRNVEFKIFKFDSSTGLLPDVTLGEEGYFDNAKKFIKSKMMPKVQKPDSEGSEEDDAEDDEDSDDEDGGEDDDTKQKSDDEDDDDEDDDDEEEEPEINPNFRYILIDQKVKEEKIDDLNIGISLVSSRTKDGSPPSKIDDFIAVPSFPRTNETVKGSSLMDKCSDSTWDKSIKCPEYMSEAVCKLWKCTLNMRTVNPEAVDTLGTTCDKIGVSVDTWANHRRVCHSSNGSCLKQQLGWYFSQHKEESKIPKLYGVEPAITVQTLKPSPKVKDDTKTTWFDQNRVHYLNYAHTLEDVSTIKIDTFEASVTEIVSDFPGFIVSAKIDRECKFNSPIGCNLEVAVKNMGLKKSDFTIRAQCYNEKSERNKENEVAYIEETTMGIEGNKSGTFSVPIKLTGKHAEEKPVCFVTLSSGLKKVLDNYEVPVKITGTKPNFGKDPVRLDPKVFTAPEPKKQKVIPPEPKPFPTKKPEVIFKETKPIEVKTDEVKTNEVKPTETKADEPVCMCAKWNLFCMIINFRTCVVSQLNKVYMYIIIGLAILLFLIFLPVLVPLVVYLVKGLIKLCKMPLKHMEQRKARKVSNGVDLESTSVIPIVIQQPVMNHKSLNEM